jgi:hypothetical protein
MRSAAIAAASVIGAASAQTNNANVNAAIAGCVNTCQPILAASSSCGFPVPSDPTVALNPVAWGNAAWGTNNNWGNWGGYGGNWGGYSGYSGWGGWKKRDVQGSSVPANTLNTGFLTGNWGGNWNSNLQCVCNTQSFDVDQVGAQCLSCVNNALNVNYGNPCKFFPFSDNSTPTLLLLLYIYHLHLNQGSTSSPPPAASASASVTQATTTD